MKDRLIIHMYTLKIVLSSSIRPVEINTIILNADHVEHQTREIRIKNILKDMNGRNILLRGYLSCWMDN